MAAKKKKYNPHRGPTPTDVHLYAEFAADFLDGTIKATALEEKHGGPKLDLEYTDPEG